MYTFPNGKRYIGKTKRSLSRRKGCFFDGYKRCTLLWNAIQKYGVENIQQDILVEEEMIDKKASDLEIQYIAEYRTNCNRYSDPPYGYNLTDGGEGLLGWHPSEERLKVLREQMRTFHEQAKGKHPSKETRKKQSEAKKGKKRGALSEETKRKISVANSRENMSHETQKRRSAAVKKRVTATNNDTGEILEFISCEDAAKHFGVRSSAITRWASGERKPRNNNYTFKIYPRTTTKRENVA